MAFGVCPTIGLVVDVASSGIGGAPAMDVNNSFPILAP